MSATARAGELLREFDQSRAQVDPYEVTQPGVYEIPDEVYHGGCVPERLGGSLSVSGAKRLLSPNCPALFDYERRNGGRPNKTTFDFGHAAHLHVLGVGAEIVAVDAENWTTKAAKEAKAAAYEADKVPLLVKDVAAVKEMADAIRAHPIASALLNPENGKPEQALFRQDDQEGVWLRAKLDWLPNSGDGRMVIPDYKTAVSANPSAFAKNVSPYGYHMQAGFYMDMVLALGLADDAAFVFVVQEKTPPYLVTVVELDSQAVRIGRELNREAIDLYASCQSSGIWPGYSEEVELIALPAWATYSHNLRSMT